MTPATRLALAMLAAAALGGTATAADRSGHRGADGAGLFEMFDTDGDGTVKLDEAKQVRDARRTRFDADGDGALTLGEFAPLHAEVTRPRMVDAFQRLDADGDGKVTAAEYDRPFDRIGQRLDTDGDGDIDRSDMAARRGDRDGGWFTRR